MLLEIVRYHVCTFLASLLIRDKHMNFYTLPHAYESGGKVYGIPHQAGG